jgi:hypothetical protein
MQITIFIKVRKIVNLFNFLALIDTNNVISLIIGY